MRVVVYRPVAANALQLSIPFEADRILRFLHGLARKNPALAAITARDAMVNGSPGFVMRESDGSIDTMAIEHSDGKIVAIYLTRNPDKVAARSILPPGSRLIRWAQNCRSWKLATVASRRLRLSLRSSF